ncbi:unnamed protein product [Camellia sinensis]
MADAAAGGEDTWVDIPAGRCLMRYASENEREADIRHGKIETMPNMGEADTLQNDGISVEKSFLRFGTMGEAKHVHENLSKLEGDSFLKSCLIISHQRYYWLAVDRFDCSLKRYCDEHPQRWNKSQVLLDPNDEVVIRYQLKPTYQQIVRDIITGIYQLHSQKYWHGDLSIRDILIVNHRAKFAFLRGDRVDPKNKKRDRGGSPDKRGEDFEKLRTVFMEVLRNGIANGGQNMPDAELNHFHNNAAQEINNWQSLAKLFFHPLLMTPMERFHLPVTMRTIVRYPNSGYQWRERHPRKWTGWITNVRGDYTVILSDNRNNACRCARSCSCTPSHSCTPSCSCTCLCSKYKVEYEDNDWDQFTFVRNTIVHINGPNRTQKTEKKVEQELSVMLPSSFTNVYDLFNVKALASTSVQIFEE